MIAETACALAPTRAAPKITALVVVRASERPFHEPTAGLCFPLRGWEPVPVINWPLVLGNLVASRPGRRSQLRPGLH